MNKEQNTYYRAYLSTQNALDDNTSIWTGNPKFAEVKNQLDEKLDAIEQLDEKASANTKGGTRNKDTIREVLEIKALVLGGAIYSHGVLTNDEQLKELAETSISNLKDMRETELVTYVESLLKAAGELQPEQLNEYGVTEAELTDVSTTLDEFRPLMGRPKQKRAAINAAKQSLDSVIGEARELLSEVLDKLMLRYRFTHPEFYTEYEQSRTIVG